VSATETETETETGFWTASGAGKETGIEIASEIWTDAIVIETVSSIDGNGLSVEMI
jgi:hypothetical protein